MGRWGGGGMVPGVMGMGCAGPGEKGEVVSRSRGKSGMGCPARYSGEKWGMRSPGPREKGGCGVLVLGRRGECGAPVLGRRGMLCPDPREKGGC